MKRDISLDIFRGLMLVIMAIDHFGGPFRQITFQTFGYVSGAEGFVFLSGVVFGFVYSRYLDETNIFLKRKAAKRALVIYIYHIILLIIIFFLLVLRIIPPKCWIYDVSQIQTSPYASIFLYLGLLYKPYLMDILPMYVIFLLFAPYLLIHFNNKKSKTILFISVLLWFAAQLNFIWYPLEEFQGTSKLDFGQFNLFAWQFLFITGIWIGNSKFLNMPVISYRREYVILATTFALLFFLLRHLNRFITIPFITGLVGVETLEIGRLFNFLILVYLIGWLIRNKKIGNLKWLALLGRNSLEVFSYHIVVIYLYKPLQQTMDWQYKAILSLLFAVSLTIPAIIHEKIKFKKSSSVVR